jgi:hypothetical protein
LPIRLILPVISCFLDPEFRNFNRLTLIPLGLARAMRERIAEGSSSNPRGRPRGIPIPSGACPILRPGH